MYVRSKCQSQIIRANRTLMRNRKVSVRHSYAYVLQGLCRQDMYNFTWSGLLLKCVWSMTVGCDSLAVRSGRRLYSSALTMNESLYLSDGSVHIVRRHDRTVCCAYLSCGWWTYDFYVSRMHYDVYVLCTRTQYAVIIPWLAILN